MQKNSNFAAKPVTGKLFPLQTFSFFTVYSIQIKTAHTMINSRKGNVPLFAAALILFIVSCQSVQQASNDQQNFVQYVNPYIGTEGHGHVFLGANVPFGAVQLGPSNIMQTWDRFNGWDWCSGYNYISKEILGFTHTHLSGTGIGDLNDILVCPANGVLQTNPMPFNKTDSGYGSFYTHDKEVAKPGYYKVYLDKYKVQAELTTSERVGFHQYKYEKSDSAHLLVDLAFGMGWDAPAATYIKKVNDTLFTGYRFSTGWAVDQRVYFALVLSKPVTSIKLFNETGMQKGDTAKGKKVKAALYVDVSKDSVVKVKVGLSPVSAENALANISAEIPHWDFNKTVTEATGKWNTALGKIAIDADADTRTVFYTSLYHTMMFPSLFNDHNGDYLGTDKKVYTAPGFNNYTIFSLWDTYRGIHPLMTIIEPSRVNDFIKSFLAIYKQQGKLPVWPLQGNETNCMIGYPAVPIIADAYLKGFRDYDTALAYEAVKQSAMRDTDGVQFIQHIKYIPADSIPESVAKAMEYAISDWCIAQMAKAMNKKDDYDYFSKRAKAYANYFDASTKHMRGRMSNGGWRTPFNPFNAVHRENDYCEGNGWQYTWLVPQDVEGLISLMGGDKPFLQKLDSLFTVPSALDAKTSPDISGMIGQYAQGNEPNHHIPYLYAYAGEQWKTASLVRKVADTFFTNKPNGLCGNEDAGEMSAWYVFSAMGFYPVNPANGAFVFGSPLIKKATINLPGNKQFTITANNQSKQNKYIQKVELNGQPYTRSYIRYEDIMKGGELVLYMGEKPSAVFGVKPEDRPKSSK